MPKRKYSGNVDRYEKVLKKLKERRRVRIIESDSSDSDNQNDENNIDLGNALEDEMLSRDQPQEEDNVNININDVPVPELNPELLNALGGSIEDSPMFGPDIHDSLTKLWAPILRKGLDKEVKEKLLKQHLMPKNCALLQAPKLNPEISAAVNDTILSQDKRVESSQNQLGASITALNRGLEILLGDDGDKLQAVKSLSESCRLLCDLHFGETLIRKKFVTPSLDKSFLNIIQDIERDEMLFGSKLSEKIKASKVIEKQGLQIKKATNVTKTPTQAPQSQITHPRPTYLRPQGNWSGPPRFQSSSRGGAGRTEENYSSSAAINNHGSTAEDLEPEQVPCTNTPLLKISPSITSQSYPGGREALRIAFSRRNTPRVAIDLMFASVSESTMKQYAVTYKLWWQYCLDNDIDTFDPSMPVIMGFLADAFNTGASYGSVNTHRSALSLLLGNNLGSDEQIKRLMKGIYKQKPSRPKYCNTWDPQIVLNYISNWYPNTSLTLEQLTKKLSILLALCTGHRVQTLSLIRVPNILTTSTGVNILITDIIKTSAAGKEQPTLFLPYFIENTKICPVTTLNSYLSATKNLRLVNSDRLLITHKRPYKNATTQSISRWIKQTLMVSGVDVSIFSSHSTRHASTSAAAAAGLDINIIRKTAGWTNTSLTFAKFYNRPINDSGLFARTVCSIDT